MKRELIYDTLKYFAIILVILGHYTYDIGHSYTEIAKVFPYSIVLYGLSAKCGVGIFSVVSGLFAHRSGKNTGFCVFVLKRYVNFVLCGFIANSLYYLFNINGIAETSSLGFVIGQSVLLGNGIFDTFWFLRQFFVGSIISYIIGRYDIGITETFAVSLILFGFNRVFISLFLLGCIADKMLDKNRDLFKDARIQLLMAVLIFVLIKRESNDLTYYIQGLCMIMLIILINSNKSLYRICSSNVLSFLGKMTMAILIVHTDLAYLVLNFIYNNYIPALAGNILVRSVIWFLITHIIAIPVYYLLKVLNRMTGHVIDRLYPRLEAFIGRQKDRVLQSVRNGTIE